MSAQCVNHTMAGNRAVIGNGCGKQEAICKEHSVRVTKSPGLPGTEEFCGMFSARM